MEEFPLSPIATIECPYQEKFAVPRQPGLVTSVAGKVVFESPYHDPMAFAGLEEFSHIWLIFRFHQNLAQGWKPTVRPPRLGGNKKMGVFATRSSFRPNGIGMSVVRLLDITFEKDRTLLSVSGIDLVSGTPVYDIKPYVPYSDAISDAQSGFATDAPVLTDVVFSATAEDWMAMNITEHQRLKTQISEVLAQDPRPAYRKLQTPDENEYGIAFAGLNIKWRAQKDRIEVISLENINK